MDITSNNTEDKMYKEPVMTYNHMQEETSESVAAESRFGKVRNNVVFKFIAEELIIALLLALIFYMI